ncbi:HAMP domain-containing histidine kinase [candidate division KSB1 bacterium]|nr:HAMP domain-containing histidine kinase [candidate division KSB1 bacterium]
MQSEKELLRLIERVAHKIKNPLHSIGLNLEALRLKIENAVSKDKNSLLKHIDITQREQQRLEMIIQSAIDYLQPCGQKRQRTDLIRVFAAIKQFVIPAAQERKIELSFQVEKKNRPLNVNSQELSNALVYLILNAVEIAKAQVNILAMEKGSTLQIEIQDDGEGLTKDEVVNIVQYYYTTKQGHVGMGIPLAKKYIEGNGGKLRVQSRSGSGTTFIITFEK